MTTQYMRESVPAPLESPTERSVLHDGNSLGPVKVDASGGSRSIQDHAHHPLRATSLHCPPTQSPPRVDLLRQLWSPRVCAPTRHMNDKLVVVALPSEMLVASEPSVDEILFLGSLSKLFVLQGALLALLVMGSRGSVRLEDTVVCDVNRLD